MFAGGTAVMMEFCTEEIREGGREFSDERRGGRGGAAVPHMKVSDEQLLESKPPGLSCLSRFFPCLFYPLRYM